GADEEARGAQRGDEFVDSPKKLAAVVAEAGEFGHVQPLVLSLPGDEADGSVLAKKKNEKEPTDERPAFHLRACADVDDDRALGIQASEREWIGERVPAVGAAGHDADRSVREHPRRVVVPGAAFFGVDERGDTSNLEDGLDGGI